MSLAATVVAAVLVCKKRKQAKKLPEIGKKVPLPRLQTSRAGSRASVRSTTASRLLEAKTAENAADVERNASAKQLPQPISERPATGDAQKSPRLAQTTAAKETPLLGEGELGESSSVASAGPRKDACQKKLDDLDALLWDNALGGAERMGQDEQESRRRMNRRARQHVAATLQGVGKGEGLTPMKMGGRRQDEDSPAEV